MKNALSSPYRGKDEVAPERSPLNVHWHAGVALRRVPTMVLTQSIDANEGTLTYFGEVANELGDLLRKDTSSKVPEETVRGRYRQCNLTITL